MIVGCRLWLWPEVGVEDLIANYVFCVRLLIWQEDAEAREIADTGKRDVELSVGENRVEEVETYTLVCSTLGFIDGLSKGGKDRELLTRERDVIAVRRREGDSRQEELQRALALGKRNWWDELALENIGASTVKYDEARAVTQALLYTHVAQKHINASLLEGESMWGHSVRVQRVEVLGGDHVEVVAWVEDGGVDGVSNDRLRRQAAEDGFVELHGAGAGRRQDHALTHAEERVLIYVVTVNFSYEVIVCADDGYLWKIGEVNAPSSRAVLTDGECESGVCRVRGANVVLEGQLSEVPPETRRLYARAYLHRGCSALHDGKALPEVSPEDDALAAEGNVVVGEVAQEAVHAVKVVLVGHGALVPDDEGGVEDVSSLLRAVTDLGHRVFTAGNGSAEHLVLRDAVEQDCCNARGGAGDDTLARTEEVVAQRVIEEGLP